VPGGYSCVSRAVLCLSLAGGCRVGRLAKLLFSANSRPLIHVLSQKFTDTLTAEEPFSSYGIRTTYAHRPNLALTC
jgi:hypothetical protein